MATTRIVDVIYFLKISIILCYDNTEVVMCLKTLRLLKEEDEDEDDDGDGDGDGDENDEYDEVVAGTM